MDKLDKVVARRKDEMARGDEERGAVLDQLPSIGIEVAVPRQPKCHELTFHDEEGGPRHKAGEADIKDRLPPRGMVAQLATVVLGDDAGCQVSSLGGKNRADQGRICFLPRSGSLTMLDKFGPEGFRNAGAAKNLGDIRSSKGDLEK